MRNIEIKKKIKRKTMQCILCQANFQTWLNNLELSDERKEKISQHFLDYCPACTKFDGKV